MKSQIAKIDRCELTDHYEVAIIHKTPLHMKWQDDNGEWEQRIDPYDLRADKGKEFLIARGMDGQELRIDLDQVISVREFEQEH